MHERIKEIRLALKLTQKEFATKIGIQNSSFSEIENGKAKITERTIISICSVFNVNEKYLRDGQGDMFKKIDTNFEEFYSIYKELSDPLQDFLLQSANNLIDLQEKL